MVRRLRELTISSILTSITAQNTSIVPLNPKAGSRLPAVAEQNADSAWAGTVSVTVIRPCIVSGVLPKMNPSCNALMIGNGRHITALAISSTQ